MITASLLSLAMLTPTKTLELERIFDSPNLSGPSPTAVKIAPDGSRVTFLRGKDSDQNVQDLWEFNVASGEVRRLVDSRALVPEEGELSDEEKARRERQRLAGLSGIIEYLWAPDAAGLLFPLGGDLHWYDLKTNQARQLTDDDEFETDPKVSPQGSYVAFVKNQDLQVINLSSGQVKALTNDGDGTIKNGMAEFIAQEEMDRDTGYWWSPDDSQIAFLQIDESPVEIAERHEINAAGITVVRQRYPYTGTPNITYKLGVVDVASGSIRWLDIGDNKDIYIPRVNWLPDSKQLAVQRQTRDQQTLDLMFFDTQTGKHRKILQERSNTWINLHKDLHFLSDANGFVWTSERDGFRHVYHYGLNGELIRQVTTGDWQVDEIEAVSEGQIYFTGTKDSWTEKHLYRVALSGGDVERVTKRAGSHDVVMADDASVYVDTFSSRQQPPQVSLHNAAGKRLTWLLENDIDADHPYAPYLAAHLPNEFGTLQAEDGQMLQYRMVKPRNFDPSKKYPVLVHVYGGPGVQMADDRWDRRTLIEQYAAQQGYLVFVLDNRGSKRRGTRFENPIYRSMGIPEVKDQAVGVEYLRTLDFVDPDRVGVFGWSYGGYMALMTVMQRPDLFSASVSGAPVTDWSLYDTHYTERYMSTPQDNADGYAAGNVLSYANQLEDPLLIIHGMADDNVLFTHSTKLFSELQSENKLFDIMTYPGAKHRITGQANETHLYRTIFAFLDRHLRR